MGKVYRQDRKSVQRIKARDIVPGDVVEVAGTAHSSLQLLGRAVITGGAVGEARLASHDPVPGEPHVPLVFCPAFNRVIRFQCVYVWEVSAEG